MEIRTIQVADIELPEEVGRLRELAYDLWWSWSPSANRLFGWIDVQQWRRYHNPIELLINIEPHHWRRLLADPAFRRAYDQAIADLDGYRARETWFSRLGVEFPGPIAYFSMEFGLHESIGVYSGGLGVLAGDHCKAASDLGIPLVGVGPLYRYGYFRQTVDADGYQQHIYPNLDFTRLPILPVQAPEGGPLTVPIDLPGRAVQAAVWKVQVGSVPVLLLDTDIPQNDPADRPITAILYVRGREMRLCQEVVLGVGGVRALRALDIHPAVWHMNEGHVALLALERARERVLRGEGLSTSLKGLVANTVFTTHTPVPAGNETFDPQLVRRYLEPWARDVGGEPEAVLRLGTEQGHFNLTALAIRTSSSTNGVSQLHGEVSSDMWRHLFPGQPKRPISAITNGVHTESWIGPEMRSLFVEHLGQDWEEHLLDPPYWERIQEVPPEELWAARRSQRERLIRFVRERLRLQGARHGASPGELRALEALLDPHALTIGFARRFATYKRAVLLLSDLERLKTLVADPQRPVQFVFAGKAHPADREGQGYIRHLFLLAGGELQGKLVFLENYDIEMGRMLVGGSDVWLNTPRRPHEASGTSGQKVPINGGLNLSILDGWWAEGYREEPANGWAIGAGLTDPDPAAQDRQDAESLYQLLEEEAIPTFYDRDEKNLPQRWIEMMKQSIATVVPTFSARRMVKEYVEDLYLPAAARR